MGNNDQHLSQKTRHLFCASLLLALLIVACSGLAGEPQIVATIPPEVVDIGLPPAPPDIIQGAQIYAENCTRCHGPAGQGNGELVLSGQITTPPRDFTDPATTRGQTPGEWFATITNGRLENLMPPWRESLSEAQRWAVALYTYTLSYQADQIAQGQTVWEANCAECHGDTGVGDGPRAAELSATVGNLAQPDALIALSDAALFETIAQGKGEAMPAFADTLDDVQVWAVIAYARTLSIANANFIGQTVPGPAATAEVEVASAPEVLGSISGQVNNGTAGGALPSDLTVTLHILDDQFNEETLETSVAPDGTFAFNEVTIRDDRAYITSTLYQDRIFGSNLVTGNTAIPALDLPITVYELTDDPSVITITGLVTQVSASPGSLQAIQIMTFMNTSDRLYSQNEALEDGRYASVNIPIPPGAQVLDIADEAGRYARSGAALLDTRPVFPGEDHIVHVIYNLPYQDSASIQLPLNYALEGSVRLLLPDTLGAFSERLPPLGPQTLGESVYQSYGAALSLSPGDVLSYTVTGSPTASSPPAAIPTTSLLAYALIAIGSLALLASAALYFFGRRSAARSASIQQVREMLIEQIAELDDLHQKGQINKKAYREQRDRLKARLAKLMDET